VDFDTGSSDLFVPSTKCGSCGGKQDYYDPDASSTSEDRGKTFTITYGGGATVDGEQYTDNVIIAGLKVRGAMVFSSFSYKALTLLNIGNFPGAWLCNAV
jgi:cathepsin D